ncbi:hypothetical protein MKW94_009028 [Papaver nudicaule]|uniref:Bidirectional sugar transporter SWEET n=1 Tax=Papaver nudicaule TaxID=74823 RepID=A0AA42B084_PAPNU|nr:hypothetical protein [Papaver nudicaule]
MDNTEIIRTIFGTLGNVISFGLFLYPAATFLMIMINNGAVEEYSPNPHLATAMNCLLWVFYGLPFVHPKNIFVVTINGMGLGFQLIYLSIFLIYATKKRRSYVLSVLAGEAVFLTAVVLLLTLLCAVVNIITYTMQLHNLRQAYEAKSSNYMPIELLLFNALNGGCWLTYGLLRFDIYLVVSYGLGFVLGIIQIILWFWYNNPEPKDQEVEVQRFLPGTKRSNSYEKTWDVENV